MSEADPEAFVAVARRVAPEGRLLAAEPLTGGVSASMHVLEIEEADGRVCRVVVRRHGTADWRPHAENVTRSEFALLAALGDLDLPVPRPRLLDESGSDLPTPYFVMDFVEGTSTVPASALPGAMREMAAFLARLHGIDVETAQRPRLPDREDPRDAILEYLPAAGLGDRVRAALASGAAGEPASSRSLLHGDFWPGNVLWQDDRIAAVLDWEDAAIGDPLSDLACCRVELLCAYGASAMDAFTSHYLEHANVDVSGLPLWELYVSASALATMPHWGLEPEVLAVRQRHTTAFLERAAADFLTPAGAAPAS